MKKPDADWNWKHIAALGVLSVLLFGVVAASSFYGSTDGQVLWQSPNGPDITTTDVDVEDPVPIRTGTVDFGHATFESDGKTAATVSGWDGPYLVLDNLDVDGANLSVATETAFAEIGGGADRLEVASDPAVDNDNADYKIRVSSTATLEMAIPDGATGDIIVLADADTGEGLVSLPASEEEIVITVDQDRDLEFRSYDVEFSDASPTGGEVLSQSVNIELSITVDHPSMADGQIDVNFYDASDDSLIGSDQLDEPGEATVSWSNPPMGYHEWYVETDDGDLQHQSETHEFGTPHELLIKDEQTAELLDEEGTEITVRFFVVGGDDETVISETTTNGVVNLEGLPTDHDLVVDAKTEGYFDRSIIIRDIARQQSIYLLDETADVNSVAWQLRDRTGAFDPETSRVLIRKPIEEDGETTYRTIVGDTFGANEIVETRLEAGDRYRVVVENQHQDTRSFGSYVADTPGDLVILDVGEISIAPPEPDSFVIDARESTIDEDGIEQDIIRIVYRDDSETTEELRVTIYERHNESNVLYGPETWTGNSISETIHIPEEQQGVSAWILEWELDRSIDEETRDGQEFIGGLSTRDWPLSGTMLQTLGIGAVLLVAGLFGGRLSQIGGVVTVCVAWALSAIGFLDIPIEFLIAAGVIAVLFLIGSDRREVRA